MSKDPHPVISRIQREVDELRLQLALGRVEAAGFLEEQKEKLKERVDQARQHVESNPLITPETTAFLKGRLEELRLQLALGRMESRDAVAEQLPRITRAMDLVKEGMSPLRETAGDAFRELSDRFEQSAGAFRAKLGAVGDALGLHVDPPPLSEIPEQAAATPVADEGPLARKRRQLEERLEELSRKARQAAHLAGEELEKLGSEVSESFARIRAELASEEKPPAPRAAEAPAPAAEATPSSPEKPGN